jgi:hypothetical protein
MNQESAAKPDEIDRLKAIYDQVHPLYLCVLEFSENRAVGKSPLELSRSREAAQSKILDIMSDYFGVNVRHTPIDANGEFMFTAVAINPDGSMRDSAYGCGMFGEQWAQAFSKYPQRCGTNYHLNAIDKDSGWVRLSHFGVDGVVMDFHDNIFDQVSALQEQSMDTPSMGM